MVFWNWYLNISDPRDISIGREKRRTTITHPTPEAAEEAWIQLPPSFIKITEEVPHTVERIL